ncbi:hypothetical protein BY996DRAFT_6505516 [Phakopsora pachyrhizi]|nr:hypothetical protein BY996DRAFT_6505516 [Phakopsora pachyrhizi]
MESDKPDSLNTPSALSLEATFINQNFGLQVVKEDPDNAYQFDNPNPFYGPDETEPCTSAGLRCGEQNCAALRVVRIWTWSMADVVVWPNPGSNYKDFDAAKTQLFMPFDLSKQKRQDKIAAAFISNCSPTNNREKVLAELIELLPGKIDSFGGFELACGGKDFEQYYQALEAGSPPIHLGLTSDQLGKFKPSPYAAINLRGSKRFQRIERNGGAEGGIGQGSWWCGFIELSSGTTHKGMGMTNGLWRIESWHSQGTGYEGHGPGHP